MDTWLIKDLIDAATWILCTGLIGATITATTYFICKYNTELKSNEKR